MVGVEVGRLHHVDRAVDRLAHEVRVRVVPGDDRVEAFVEVEPRVHGVQPNAVPELSEARERTLALGGSQVVEDAAGHQEVGRRSVGLRLELGERERRVEREVDIMAQEQVARGRLAVEESESVAAGLRRVEQFPIVLELEVTGHRHALGTERSLTRRDFRVTLAAGRRLGTPARGQVSRSVGRNRQGRTTPGRAGREPVTPPPRPATSRPPRRARGPRCSCRRRRSRSRGGRRPASQA